MGRSPCPSLGGNLLDGRALGTPKVSLVFCNRRRLLLVWFFLSPFGFRGEVRTYGCRPIPGIVAEPAGRSFDFFFPRPLPAPRSERSIPVRRAGLTLDAARRSQAFGARQLFSFLWSKRSALPPFPRRPPFFSRPTWWEPQPPSRRPFRGSEASPVQEL